MPQSKISVDYEYGPPLTVKPTMLFGHGRNTIKPQCFPQGCDIIRLHDSGTPWSALNPSKGVYVWTTLDAQVDAIKAQGKKILYTFSHTPAWAALAVPQGAPSSLAGPNGNCPPNPQASLDFITAIVTRYKGVINVYESWNESNYSGYWCGTSAQLGAWQQTLWNTVKSIDLNALVTTPNVTYSWSGNNILTVLPSYIQWGWHKMADIISIHGYLPDGAPATDIQSTLDGVNYLLYQNSISLPVWDTEFGFKSPALVPDADKRQWIIDSLMVRLSAGIGCAIWYAWDNQSHGTMCDLFGNINIAGQTWVDVYNTVK